MKLTVDINFADRTASLAERHSLAAGDTYNPLVLELSRLTEAELASVDTGTLSLVLYRSQADRTVVASANMFSVPTGKKSLRTAALLLNQQSMKDWFAAEGGRQTTCYLEVSDSETLYAACDIPIILRDFTVGSSSEGYYTASQVDALLNAKQALIETFSGLSFADGTLSLLAATASRLGGVKVGSGLSVQEDGTLSVTFPTVDSELSDSSTRAIQNRVVALAFAGIANRLAALDDDTTGRVKLLETALAGKASSSDLATVATSGSYNDLSDKPTIPETAPAAAWIAGTGVTGTSTTPTVFSGSGVESAKAGDMYLNTSTGNVYTCTLGGDAATAEWKYEGNIKGAKGDDGDPGAVTVSASYSSVSAMQNAWSSDSVPANGLVVIDSSDADSGKIYRKGPAQYVYLANLRGPRGDAGAGARWLAGTGVTGTSTTPAVFSGSGAGTTIEGDMYLNSSTGNVYRCTLGGAADTAKWAFVRCIAGAPGSDGADGSTIHAGTAVSSAAAFEVAGAKAGDLYFNTSSGSLYRCTSVGTTTSTWALAASLVGPAGADGRTWFHGSAVTAPGTYAVPGARAGDLYLGSNGSAYSCTSTSGDNSTWALVVDLRGADGADGSVIHSGTQVSAAGDATILGAKAGDFYLNSSSRDFFRCSAESGGTSTWVHLFNLAGTAGPSSTTSGYVPTWNSTTGSLLGSGYYVATSMPVSAAAGAGQLITAGAVFAGIATAVEGLLASVAHTEDHVPAWGAGAALKAGYAVRTSIRESANADNASLVTEKAVRDLFGNSNGSVTGPDTTTSGNIPKWSATSRDLADGYGFRANDAVRAAASASNAVIPSEKSVRLALDALMSSVLAKRIDEFAAPADNTSGNVSTAAHGLCPKLDGDADHFLNGLGQFVALSALSQFAGSTPGMVPESTGATNKFLRADGSWAAPADTDYTLDVHGLTAGSAGVKTDEIPVYDGTDVKKKTLQQLLSVATYDVYFVQAGAFAPSKTNGATVTPLQFTNVTHDVVQFASGTTDQSAEFDVAFPDDWDGSDVKARVIWTPYAGTGSTGDWVRFKIGAVSYKEGDSISGQVSTFTDIDDQMISPGQLHKSPASGDIAIAGTVGEGNLVHFVLKRDADYHPSGGAALASDASVLGVQLQFKRACDFTGWTAGA